MHQVGSRSGAAIKVAQLLLLAVMGVGCARGKNPEGVYELISLDVEVQDPVHGYLELKKGGVLTAHWLIPESVIALLSGYRETPAEKRHQFKGSAEHFVGSWQSAGSDIRLAVAGKGPTCRLLETRLECSSANGTKQIYQRLGAGMGLPDWAKSGKPVELGKGGEGAAPFGEWKEGERLSVRLDSERGAATDSVRADMIMKDDQATSGIFAPQRVRLQIGYPLLGEWPVATMTIQNDVTCETVKSETELRRSPVAFVRGRPSVQIQRVDLEFGCASCASCSAQVESKTLTFLSGR
jgi:hypothetical protein